MCIKNCLVSRVIVSLILVSAVLAGRPAVVVADETDAATKAAAETEAAALAAIETKLEELFKEMDLFYKVGKTETGGKTFTVMYEYDGATSRITCAVRSLGVYGGKTIYSMSAWTVVSAAESAMPPNVIKLVATDNDSLLLGNYSMSQNFQTVYSNGTIPFDDASSAGSVFMCFAYTHVNNASLKKKIDAILASN